jgi:hypothetical protein
MLVHYSLSGRVKLTSEEPAIARFATKSGMALRVLRVWFQTSVVHNQKAIKENVQCGINKKKNPFPDLSRNLFATA